MLHCMSFLTYAALSAASPHEESWSNAVGLSNTLLYGRDLPIGTCNAQTPCPNGACCGTDGLCGYSPTQCGKGNCTSNCDAKAQCGQYGTPGHQNCPLGVCCSQFGFCGSTDDFCNKGCQSGFGGCGPPKRPSCGTGSGSVGKRTIGYYESWSSTRTCQKVNPEDLNLDGYTHINFAFAFFDPSSFAIAPMDGTSGQLYNRFTNLKTKRPGLQTWISVGGWSFTDPGPTRQAFSTMTSSQGNRASFISQLTKFMDSYGFDGVDLDWEYPQADDRGGVAADTANYVSLVKEMRAAFGTRYGISMTLPTSYWYLQHFDLAGIQPNIDWFNLMAYDLHGVWDAESKYVGPYLATHTNITEIDLGLDLLWRAGVDSSKVVLGQAFYGRSFTLKDPGCSTPNGVCQFTGGANAGPCSNAAGILDNREIADIISSKNVKPELDKTAGVKWITWDSNQWVSYDDADTFAIKRDFANNRCLGGLMVWAMDQVDQSAPNAVTAGAGVSSSQQSDAQQKSQDLAAGVSCRTTSCNQKCPKGTNQVAQVGGQPGQLSTADQCPKGQYRNVCCDDGTFMGICTWRGYRGAGLSCVKGCEDGETEVLTDTKYHDKHGDTTCSGGLQSYCCKGFKSAQAVKKAAEDTAKEVAEQAAEQAAIDIAAKAFCRIAVPALLAPLELLEDLIPIVGEILDIAEIAATPALIDLCTKEVEKEGSAELKIFGKKHTISGFDKPTAKPTETRPPESSHTKPSTSDSCARDGKKKRAPDEPRCAQDENDNNRNRRRAPAATGHIACDYAAYPQACYHYSSVVRNNPTLATVTCHFKKAATPRRPAVDLWNGQRNFVAWNNKIPAFVNRQGEPDSCQRDEWPPALFLRANNGRDQLEPVVARFTGAETQYIRFNPGSQNGGAGQGWSCLALARHSHGNPEISYEAGAAGGRPTKWEKYKETYTRSVFTFNLAGAPPAPHGDAELGQNPCRPVEGGQNQGRDHRGYALLFGDDWFTHNAALDYRNAYRGTPTKRDLEDFHPDQIAVIGTDNSTRIPTDEELARDFGIVMCEDGSCSKEAERYGDKALVVPAEAHQVSPYVLVETVATTTSAAIVQTNETPAAAILRPERVRPISVDLPIKTASPLL
ncbi:hypothetical protein AMS68_007539 [Peltaster fructicola]|uniref:chitinase n=1 Tax=Peltaster fructicola TaxID=286661 RepID=A0A6H0Y4R6_9PEZI|nr:hypothetical protein AMS68_007539 [Peltaster fructicola]